MQTGTGENPREEPWGLLVADDFPDCGCAPGVPPERGPPPPEQSSTPDPAVPRNKEEPLDLAEPCCDDVADCSSPARRSDAVDAPPGKSTRDIDVGVCRADPPSKLGSRVSIPPPASRERVAVLVRATRSREARRSRAWSSDSSYPPSLLWIEAAVPASGVAAVVPALLLLLAWESAAEGGVRNWMLGDSPRNWMLGDIS